MASHLGVLPTIREWLENAQRDRGVFHFPPGRLPRAHYLRPGDIALIYLYDERVVAGECVVEEARRVSAREFSEKYARLAVEVDKAPFPKGDEHVVVVVYRDLVIYPKPVKRENVPEPIRRLLTGIFMFRRWDENVEKALALLRKLAGIEGVESAKASNGRGKYRGDRLQLPSLGSLLVKATGVGDVLSASLYVYGRLIVGAVARSSRAIGRGLVEEIAREILGGVLGSRGSHYLAVALNDLRRLCVLSIDGGGDWCGDAVARFTLLGRVVADCVKRLLELGVPVGSEFFVFVGALPVFLCLGGCCVGGCRGDEAGVCVELAGGEVRGVPGGFVERVRRVVCERVDWLLVCGVPWVKVGMCRSGG